MAPRTCSPPKGPSGLRPGKHGPSSSCFLLGLLALLALRATLAATRPSTSKDAGSSSSRRSWGVTSRSNSPKSFSLSRSARSLVQDDLKLTEAASAMDARVRVQPRSSHNPNVGWSDKLLSLAGSTRSGPCQGPPKVLFVTGESDLQKRLNYGSTQSVQFWLKSSITLSQGLVMNSSWSCTTITSIPSGQYGIFSPSQPLGVPLVAIVGANNVLIYKINGIYSILSSSSPPCAKGFPDYQEAQDGPGVTCPALFIYKSWGVQVGGLLVSGRIDVFRSLFVKLDSLQVSMPANSIPYSSSRTRGLIRVAYTMPGGSTLPRTITISNCELYGHWELVSLVKGAAGVTVKNNYMHDFQFTAVRCGADDDYVFDCHHNVIAWNHIENLPGFKTDNGNAGIYFHTRWFSPQVHLVCNYIIGQKKCIHLDYASSGVQVLGGLCSDADYGVMVTNGKSNLVLYVIATNVRKSMAVVTCELAQSVNWFHGKKARNWEGLRRKYYDLSVINKESPYMKAICNPPTPSTFWGQKCNQQTGLSGAQTGLCTGLPLDNRIEIWGYKTGRKLIPSYYKCDNLPAAQTINVNRWVNASNPAIAAGFLDPSNMDFGVKAKSPAYWVRPYFRSCPKAMVGIMKAPVDKYQPDFNISFPATLFGRVLNLQLSQIHDPSVIAK